MTLALKTEKPFAQGGHRLCFVHPQDPQRCIKVRRPDFPLEDLRRKKGFPKTLLPLSRFDDNREEFEVISSLARNLGEAAFEHVSRCFGFEDTDLGPGLVLELVRDADGAISQTLKAHLWFEGYTPDCRDAVERFCARWRELQIPSRDLLMHNILVQRDESGRICRLVVIDGLGSPNILPFNWLPAALRERKVDRKIANLRHRIEQTLAKKARGEKPGNHGMATARPRSTSPESQG
ncbi:MAG: hypothetical protein HWE39_00260 [Oceanospirillaceae bacterium]|nr:hypothetical protein [Oceanospirillaceae bacterium]